MQSHNDTGFIARQFLLVSKEHGLRAHRIKPHWPEENGVIERWFWTLREAPIGEELTYLLEAECVLVRRYNEERLHSALGHLPPVVLYRAKREAAEAQRRKLAQARHCRREKNLPARTDSPVRGAGMPFLRSEASLYHCS